MTFGLCKESLHEALASASVHEVIVLGETISEQFREQVKALTGGRGADVIFDPVGGDIFDESTRCIAFNGRLLVIGFTSGDPSTFRSNHILIKCLSVIGVRAGEHARHHRPFALDYARELPKLAALGVMRPHISHRFPMEQAADAFRALIDRKVIGKAVIEIS